MSAQWTTQLNRMVSSEMRFIQLAEELKDYFNAPIGDFYTSSAHRWLVYTIAFIMAGLLTFIALEIYELSDPLVKIELTFAGMYAWHTAINFALSLAVSDLLVVWFIRPWGAYEERTVSKFWIIFLAACLLSYTSQRTLVYKLVALYEPALLWVHEMDPLMRPGVFPMFGFMLPFWVLMGTIATRIMLRKQSQAQELFRVRIDAILEDRQWQAEAESRIPAKDEPGHLEETENLIPLPADAGVPGLPIQKVGHVTAEDHYLRIYYQSKEGLKDILIRMTMNALSSRLPDHQFAQIHRSHIVNLEQVAGLKRSGRNMRVATKHGDFELPVSRYRLPDILPKLEKYLHPN